MQHSARKTSCNNYNNTVYCVQWQINWHASWLAAPCCKIMYYKVFSIRLSTTPQMVWQGVSHTIVIYTTRCSMSDGLLPHSMVCCVQCQTEWNASGTVPCYIIMHCKVFSVWLSTTPQYGICCVQCQAACMTPFSSICLYRPVFTVHFFVAATYI